MRSMGIVTSLLLASAVCAQAAKSCDELKSEITKKMDDKGVKSYSLEIVPTEKAKDTEGKVVGSCEGGAKKIVYSRSTTPAEKPAAAAKAAEPSKP